jgi:hypothetical protein
VLGLGGAYVSVADDPQAGFLNPAGLKTISAMAYDQSYGLKTNHGEDEIILSYVNPATESGATFSTGFWSRGLTRPNENKFYVPFIGTSWMPANAIVLGMVTRAVFKTTQVDSLSKDWTTVADISALHRGESLSFGAALERALGGAADMVPRRLRLGGSWMPDSKRMLICYEWQGDQGMRRFTFRYASSHLGGELFFGNSASIRAGYVWSEFHRYTFGIAFGARDRGWRFEGGWSLPTESGETIWSAGMSYRVK